MSRPDTEEMAVRVLDDVPDRQWNGAVERSPQGTVFHRSEFLTTIAEYSNAELHQLYAEYDGDSGDVLGFFPLFNVTRGPVTTVFSPPPNLGLPNLGPGMVTAGGLPRSGETAFNVAFLNRCHDWIQSTLAPSFTHVRTNDRYRDPRPFEWRGSFRVSPKFSFVVDLELGCEELLRRFSRDARQNIRNTSDDEYEISIGGRDAVEWIVEQVQRRYEEQGKVCSLTKPFALDLHRRLPDGRFRPYICAVDGEFASGILVLEDEDTVYRWQGGTKTDTSLPVNDLLDWRIIVDSIDRGRSRYDLVGANIPRLCEYKSKFNPELVSYHVIEQGSYSMKMMAEMYKRFDMIRRYMQTLNTWFK